MGSVLWQRLGPKLRGWKESPACQPLVREGRAVARCSLGAGGV